LNNVTPPEPPNENEHVVLLNLPCALLSFAFSAVESISKVPFLTATLTKLPFTSTLPSADASA
jgi:hypothetical protein